MIQWRKYRIGLHYYLEGFFSDEQRQRLCHASFDRVMAVAKEIGKLTGPFPLFPPDDFDPWDHPPDDPFDDDSPISGARRNTSADTHILKIRTPDYWRNEDTDERRLAAHLVPVS